VITDYGTLGNYTLDDFLSGKPENIRELNSCHTIDQKVMEVSEKIVRENGNLYIWCYTSV